MLAAGSWLMTSPIGTVRLYWGSTEPFGRSALVIAWSAAAALRPTIGGTVRPHRATKAPMSKRPPETVPPAIESVGVDEAMMRLRIWLAVNDGSMLAHRAMAPVTWGAAMLVPLRYA